MGARPARWLFLTAVLVLIADRLTKGLAQQFLSDGPPVEIIPGVVQLTFITNTGGAFGLFRSVPWLFALATIGVSIAIVWNARKVDKVSTGVALGMILGGALGNLIDRLSGGLDLSGPVTDFVDFRIWPVFNVADAAIVLGALLLVVTGSGRSEPRRRRDGSPAAAAGDGGE